MSPFTRVVAALAVGYALGAKTGGKDLDQLTRSLKLLYGTDEFADVLAAARTQLSATLRELATVVEGQNAAAETGGDLVARVRGLVEND